MAERTRKARLKDAWVAGAKAGGAEDLEKILEACRAYLLVIAQSEIPADLRAKMAPSDLVQETCAEIHQGLKQFKGASGKELLGWAREILRNNLADLIRKYRGTEKRDVARELSLDRSGDMGKLKARLEATVESPSGAAMANERDAALDTALAQLPKHYQDVILLRYREGRSFAEIAVLLGRTEMAAQRLWSRAVHALRGKVGPARSV